MTTEPGGSTVIDNSPKSPKRIFYQQLASLLNEGGFDRHMSALCKPFIANTTGPAWWSSQPSCYFRVLFVGFLEGLESEQELCWAINDSRALRDFTGLGDDVETLSVETLARIRQPLLPLIHSEAFDNLIRLLEKSGLLEGRVPELDIAALLSDPTVGAIVARVRSKDHHSYWKRLTKTGGASWSTRPSTPPKSGSAHPRRSSSDGSPEHEPFAMWIEDLSLAQLEINELSARGISDFAAHFAQGSHSVVDHVIRACIYGRGPNSVRAYTSVSHKPERELPQQMTAATLDACRSIATALAQGKRQVAVEVPVLDVDGQPALVAVHLTVTPDAEDSLQSVLVSYTDVTARKKLQVPPTSASSHIEKALSLNRVGVWEWDIANDTTYWSDAMLRIYGVSREEFTGKHSDYLDWTYPEDRESQRDSVRQSTLDAASRAHSSVHPSAASTSFKDYRVRRQDGQIRWVRGGAVEVVDDQGRPIKMQGVLWDITESKQLELQLRDSEEQYRRTVDDAPVPIIATAFDGEIIFVNDAALAYFQVGRDDIARLRATEFWEDADQRVDATTVLAERGELRGYLARLRVGSDKETRISLVNATVVEFAGRNVILSCHQDVTERERLLLAQTRAAGQLEQRQRELVLLNRVLLARDQEPRTMLEIVCRELEQGFALRNARALLLSDEGTQLVLAAQSGSSESSTPIETWLPATESSLRSLFGDEPQPIWVADASNDAQVLELRELGVPVTNTALLLAPLATDGSWLGVLVLEPSDGQEPSEDRKQLTWSVTEQTARALATARAAKLAARARLDGQKRARHTDKLDAAANMATGIARSLNNALGAVLGYSELALEDAGDRPVARDYLLQLVKGAQNLQSVLDQIASIGRRVQPEPSEVSVSAMVNDVAKLCRAVSPELVVLTQVADPLPNVCGDMAQLHQLLLHLGVNALKSLQQPGGRLEFSLDRVEVDAAFVRANPELEPGSYVHVGVNDNGAGLSEQALEHAFEPFAPTDSNDLPGFGLAVAYSIARAHRGTLTITSQVGKGTRIDAYLPASSTENLTSNGPGIESPVGNGERVLYVDDDAASCLVTARLLERLGYNYQGFDNPNEALEWFSSNAAQVDIALCDFSLPNTTGLELATELLRQRPDLPVLLTSAFAGGWSSEAVRRKHGVREIVPKPLQLRTLGRALTRNLLPQELSVTEGSAP